MAAAGNGTNAVKQLTPAQVKTAVGLQNVTNIDTTNATNIITGTLPTNVLPLVPVAKGGTGRVTLTNGTFLQGNGTGAVELRTAIQVKTDLSLDKVKNYDVATQAEAEAGSVTDKYMTPLQSNNAMKKYVDSMTTAQRAALPAAAKYPGKQVFDTSLERYYYLNNSLFWVEL